MSTKIIGNLEFNGVEVLKSEVKTNEKGEKVNCVWTDAGYFEYKDQPLEIFPGGYKAPVAKAIAAKNYGPGDLSIFPQKEEEKGVFLGKTLNLMNITDGKFVPNDNDDYVMHYSRLNPENKDAFGVGVSGRPGDGRDYSTFTVDLRNGKEDHVCKIDSEAKILTDEEDTISEKNWTKQKEGIGKHIFESNKKAKYDR